MGSKPKPDMLRAPGDDGMKEVLTVSYAYDEDRHELDLGGEALPRLVIDNRGIPQERRGGTATRLLAGASLYCYGSMLAAALIARGVDFEDLRADVVVEKDRNEQGKTRVLRMTIRCSVRVDERDEAVFRRVRKMMEQGCLITGSVHDGIAMEYELTPEFFSE